MNTNDYLWDLFGFGVLRNVPAYAVSWGGTFFSCYEFKLFFFKTIIGFVRRNYFEDNFICEGTRVQTFKQSKYDFNFKEKIIHMQCHSSATTLCIDADMK